MTTPQKVQIWRSCPSHLSKQWFRKKDISVLYYNVILIIEKDTGTLYIVQRLLGHRIHRTGETFLICHCNDVLSLVPRMTHLLRAIMWEYFLIWLLFLGCIFASKNFMDKSFRLLILSVSVLYWWKHCTNALWSYHGNTAKSSILKIRFIVFAKSI